MKKLITCSFDIDGVIITAWNGVHPDRPGHFSITKAISRMEYNDACQNRSLFGDILGVDITKGWASPLNDAIKNASNLKIDMNATLNLLVDLLVARYGEEEAKRLFNEIEKDNENITAEIEKLLTEGPQANSESPETEKQKEEENGTIDGKGTKKNGAKKGRKKSGSKDDSGAPDAAVEGPNQ